MNFKQLREKSVKGITIKRYLENPSVNELFSFYKNSKYTSIRLIDYKDILYAWDSFYATHEEFINDELEYGSSEIHYHDGILNMAYISSTSDIRDGTYIGYNLYDEYYRNFFIELIDKIEKEYLGEFIEIEDAIEGAATFEFHKTGES